MKLTENWQVLSGERSTIIDRELQNELYANHILYGKSWTIVARRYDCDDVLLKMADADLMLAIVHLTWSGKPDLHPGFPRTRFYKHTDELPAD